jgi:hypothetical protein
VSILYYSRTALEALHDIANDDRPLSPPLPLVTPQSTTEGILDKDAVMQQEVKEADPDPPISKDSNPNIDEDLTFGQWKERALKQNSNNEYQAGPGLRRCHQLK